MIMPSTYNHNGLLFIMIKQTLCSLSTVIISSSAFAAVALPDFSVPAEGQQVILNVPQLRLFLFQDGKMIRTYPIAVGKMRTQTPLGKFKIGAKVQNPTWSVPVSIQKEMAAGGKTVIKSVPPGPKNPLGPVFVRLGEPKLGLGIHGTNAPSSVPGVRSHGCVRLHSKNALDFAATVKSGSDAAVIYQQASVNVDGDNDIWVAIYRDPYNKRNLNKTNLNNSIHSWAQSHQLKVNQQRLKAILAKPSGVLTCISCSAGKTKVKGTLNSLQWTQGAGDIVKLRNTVPDNATQIIPENNNVEVNEDSDYRSEPMESPIQPIIPKAKAQRNNGSQGFDNLM